MLVNECDARRCGCGVDELENARGGVTGAFCSPVTALIIHGSVDAEYFRGRLPRVKELPVL